MKIGTTERQHKPVAHGKSTLTIQRTPHPQKGHHQIPTADLPASTQSNFIIMFILNIQNITSEFYLNNIFYIELPPIF